MAVGVEKKTSGVKNFLMVGVNQETNEKAALNSFRVKQGELKFEGEEVGGQGCEEIELKE